MVMAIDDFTNLIGWVAFRCNKIQKYLAQARKDGLSVEEQGKIEEQLQSLMGEIQRCINTIAKKEGIAHDDQEDPDIYRKAKHVSKDRV